MLTPSSCDPPDIRTALDQLAVEGLIAAIEVIDAMDSRLASAASAAMTRLTDARRSVAITSAPCRPSTPRTSAVEPCSEMLAPSRPSSGTCMNRLSYTVSRTTDAPDAIVIRAMNCACIGRKPVRLGRYVDGLQRTGANDHQPAIGRPDLNTGTFKRRPDRTEMLRCAPRTSR